MVGHNEPPLFDSLICTKYGLMLFLFFCRACEILQPWDIITFSLIASTIWHKCNSLVCNGHFSLSSDPVR